MAFALRDISVRAAVYAFLGLVLSYSVAVAMATLHLRPAIPFVRGLGENWLTYRPEVVREHGRWWCVISRTYLWGASTSWSQWESEESAWSWASDQTGSSAKSDRSSLSVPWSALSAWPSIDPSAAFVYVYENAYGWPEPCLASTTMCLYYAGMPPSEKRKMAGVLSLGDLDLPSRPLFSGLAVNTVVHAIVLWLLFNTPRLISRFIRARRGLCRWCAYPRAAVVAIALPCPECGRAV